VSEIIPGQQLPTDDGALCHAEDSRQTFDAHNEQRMRVPADPVEPSTASSTTATRPHLVKDLRDRLDLVVIPVGLREGGSTGEEEDAGSTRAPGAGRLNPTAAGEGPTRSESQRPSLTGSAAAGIAAGPRVGCDTTDRRSNAATISPSSASGSSGSDSPTLLKEKGNKAFEQSDYALASQLYRDGIEACDDDETLAQLHSNLALCLLKLQRFDEALHHCDNVLERLKAESPKVLYRRATARQGQASTKSCRVHKRALLQHARNDLLRALKGLSHSMEPSSVAMISVVERALLRTDLLLKELDTWVRGECFPTPHEQRRTVLQLLQACQGIYTNAAFNLIDWKWWCTWCQFAQFERTTEVLQLLPPGARLPDRVLSCESMPGAINNSNLLLDECSCLAQWHALYTGDARLRSNLVQGYHFEVLPREVYFALKTWYGETTTTISRRADSNIKLYPIVTSVPAQLASRCGACQSQITKYRCGGCNARYCDHRCQSSHWPYHKGFCRRGKAQTKCHPVGLTNLGNTCFLNAALQVLSHTAPLTRYFLSCQFVRDLNESNPLGTGGKLATAYYGILRDLWMNSAMLTSASPGRLKRSIAHLNPQFAGFLQQDSQELLTYFLDGLHEDLSCKSPVQTFESPPTDGNSRNMPIAGAHAWETHLQRNNSFVFKTFNGLFRSTCVCPHCNGVSNSFDTFNHVPLQIRQASLRRVTLEQCLDDFVRPECLDENNLWYCSRCRNHVHATKTIELWRLPNVLILQLKRFEVKNTMRREKNEVLVDFPTDCLDLGHYIPASEKNQFCDPYVPAVYDLFGVINHIGRLGFGHYTAFARKWDETSLSTVWTLFDDSNTRCIGESETIRETVVSPAAYVLFYRRRVFH
jgi:ubiquitin carboxyl-terminal hydrolase 8